MRAHDYVDGLIGACGRLENFPLSGRRYDDTYRVIVYRNHLLFHAHDEIEDRVSITMVIDRRRDLRRLLLKTVDRWIPSPVAQCAATR